MSDTHVGLPRRTQAQIEASRRNGALSTGPVTAEGKAKSRKNAVRHGLRAEEVVVQHGEDEDAYRDLLARLVEQFEPSDAVSAHLVRQLASIMWRSGRAERLEADLLSYCDCMSRRGDRRVVIEFDHERLRVLLRYNRELEMSFYRTLTALGLMQNPVSPNEPKSEVSV